MAGLNDLLHVSGSGLSAYQSRISVYGNNIANVDTVGYSRRTAELSAGAYADGVGGGVTVNDVARLYNSLGTATFLREESSAGQHTALASYLSDLESLAGSASGGLDSALQKFESSWQQAVALPDDPGARTVLLQSASSLATELNRIDSSLSSVGDLWGTPAEVVDGINATTSRLQELNQQIAKAEAAGRSVPALQDERDQLVRQLAQQVNFSITPDYAISLGGQELVSADGLNHQDLSVDAANNFTVNGVDVTPSVSGGKLAALVAGQQAASELLGRVNTFASSLIAQVNSIFDSAYNLNGESPAEAGYTFFTGTSAADIAVDTTLYDPSNPLAVQPGLVALAASRPSPGVPNAADNSAGQAIYDLLQAPRGELDNLSISEYWIQVEVTLGGAINEENQLAESSQTVADLLGEQMLSVSGVNLDEELMSLSEAQKSYEACARVMSTANSLLDTLINLGR